MACLLRSHWDISSGERFDILKEYTQFGLEHWGSDTQGVRRTRRFLLEWLSFTYRYIPIGILERYPQRINEKPLPYFGRNDMETLMASPYSNDWVKIRYATPRHSNAPQPAATGGARLLEM